MASRWFKGECDRGPVLTMDSTGCELHTNTAECRLEDYSRWSIREASTGKSSDYEPKLNPDPSS